MCDMIAFATAHTARSFEARRAADDAADAEAGRIVTAGFARILEELAPLDRRADHASRVGARGLLRLAAAYLCKGGEADAEEVASIARMAGEGAAAAEAV